MKIISPIKIGFNAVNEWVLIWLSDKIRVILGEEKLCFNRLYYTQLWKLSSNSIVCAILLFTYELDCILNFSSFVKVLATTI